MRHAVRSRRFGRSRSERAALVRSLAQALFRHERIQTTLPKAKEAQRAAEHLVTQAKAGTLASRRRVEAWLQDRDITKTLFAEIAPRFVQRHGGYTRIVHAGIRHGDGAPMAILELVERKPEPVKSPATATGAKKGRQGLSPRGKGQGLSPRDSEVPPTTHPPTPGMPPREKRRTPEGTVPSGKPPQDDWKAKKPGFLSGLRKFFKKGPKDQRGE
ncbi:MAG: 50S ribosomal protein L17 [Candidatus Omnitrophica bacterium]|nr:50S ribosomal protein L17 [Candidatus Omnitrophota bacterium]